MVVRTDNAPHQQGAMLQMEWKHVSFTSTIQIIEFVLIWPLSCIHQHFIVLINSHAFFSIYGIRLGFRMNQRSRRERLPGFEAAVSEKHLCLYYRIHHKCTQMPLALHGLKALWGYRPDFRPPILLFRFIWICYRGQLEAYRLWMPCGGSSTLFDEIFLNVWQAVSNTTLLNFEHDIITTWKLDWNESTQRAKYIVTVLKLR